MQRRSMLYEKVVNIQLNNPAVLHWIVIDAKLHEFWIEGKLFQERIFWHPYSAGSLTTCTKKKKCEREKEIQWNTVIFQGGLIDVITFMWQTNHIQATLYFCLMLPCQCQWDNKRNTHTDAHVQVQTHRNTLSVGGGGLERRISVLNIWLWSALFDVHYWKNEPYLSLSLSLSLPLSLCISLWPAFCFDIK